MEKIKKIRKVILFVICLSLLALIIAIVLPTFNRVKDGTSYTRVQCMANMRTIVFACQLYQEEKKNRPDLRAWNDLIKPYTGNDKAFRCYIDKIGPCSYAMNENIPADVNGLPGDLVLLFESAPGWNRTGGLDDVVTNRHDKNPPGANIAFADGHVEFVPVDKIPSLRWAITVQSSASDSK